MPGLNQTEHLSRGPESGVVIRAIHRISVNGRVGKMISLHGHARRVPRVVQPLLRSDRGTEQQLHANIVRALMTGGRMRLRWSPTRYLAELNLAMRVTTKPVWTEGFKKIFLNPVKLQVSHFDSPRMEGFPRYGDQRGSRTGA
jgi:hypothetical protein